MGGDLDRFMKNMDTGRTIATDYELKMKDLNNQLELIKNNLDSVGVGFLDYGRDVIGVLGTITSSLKEINSSTQSSPIGGVLDLINRFALASMAIKGAGTALSFMFDGKGMKKAYDDAIMAKKAMTAANATLATSEGIVAVATTRTTTAMAGLMGVLKANWIGLLISGLITVATLLEKQKRQQEEIIEKRKRDSLALEESLSTIERLKDSTNGYIGSIKNLETFNIADVWQDSYDMLNKNVEAIQKIKESLDSINATGMKSFGTSTFEVPKSIEYSLSIKKSNLDDLTKRIELYKTLEKYNDMFEKSTNNMQGGFAGFVKEKNPVINRNDESEYVKLTKEANKLGFENLTIMQASVNFSKELVKLTDEKVKLEMQYGESIGKIEEAKNASYKAQAENFQDQINFLTTVATTINSLANTTKGGVIKTILSDENIKTLDGFKKKLSDIGINSAKGVSAVEDALKPLYKNGDIEFEFFKSADVQVAVSQMQTYAETLEYLGDVIKKTRTEAQIKADLEASQGDFEKTTALKKELTIRKGLLDLQGKTQNEAESLRKFLPYLKERFEASKKINEAIAYQIQLVDELYEKTSRGIKESKSQGSLEFFGIKSENIKADFERLRKELETEAKNIQLATGQVAGDVDFKTVSKDYLETQRQTLAVASITSKEDKDKYDSFMKYYKLWNEYRTSFLNQANEEEKNSKDSVNYRLQEEQIKQNISNIDATQLKTLQSNLDMSKLALFYATSDSEVSKAELEHEKAKRALYDYKLKSSQDYAQSLITINGLTSNNIGQLEYEVTKQKELIKEYEKKAGFDKNSLEYRTMLNNLKIAEFNTEKGKIDNQNQINDIANSYKNIGQDSLVIAENNLNVLKQTDTSHMNILEKKQLDLKISQSEYDLIKEIANQRQQLKDLGIEYNKIGLNSLDISKLELEQLLQKDTTYMSIIEKRQHELDISKKEYDIQKDSLTNLLDIVDAISQGKSLIKEVSISEIGRIATNLLGMDEYRKKLIQQGVASGLTESEASSRIKTNIPTEDIIALTNASMNKISQIYDTISKNNIESLNKEISNLEFRKQLTNDEYELKRLDSQILDKKKAIIEQEAITAKANAVMGGISTGMSAATSLATLTGSVATGNVLGAVVGAVSMVGGLIGADTQERQQKDALEESKRQSALLEANNRLTQGTNDALNNYLGNVSKLGIDYAKAQAYKSLEKTYGVTTEGEANARIGSLEANKDTYQSQINKKRKQIRDLMNDPMYEVNKLFNNNKVDSLSNDIKNLKSQFEIANMEIEKLEKIKKIINDTEIAWKTYFGQQYKWNEELMKYEYEGWAYREELMGNFIDNADDKFFNMASSISGYLSKAITTGLVANNPKIKESTDALESGMNKIAKGLELKSKAETTTDPVERQYLLNQGQKEYNSGIMLSVSAMKQLEAEQDKTEQTTYKIYEDLKKAGASTYQLIDAMPKLQKAIFDMFNGLLQNGELKTDWTKIFDFEKLQASLFDAFNLTPILDNLKNDDFVKGKTISELVAYTENYKAILKDIETNYKDLSATELYNYLISKGISDLDAKRIVLLREQNKAEEKKTEELKKQVTLLDTIYEKQKRSHEKYQEEGNLSFFNVSEQDIKTSAQETITGYQNEFKNLGMGDISNLSLGDLSNLKAGLKLEYDALNAKKDAGTLTEEEQTRYDKIVKAMNIISGIQAEDLKTQQAVAENDKARQQFIINMKQTKEAVANLNRTDLGVLESNLSISKEILANAKSEKEIADATLKVRQDENALLEKKKQLQYDVRQTTASLGDLMSGNTIRSSKVAMDKSKNDIADYLKKSGSSANSEEYYSLLNKSLIDEWNYKKAVADETNRQLKYSMDLSIIGKDNVANAEANLNYLNKMDTTSMSSIDLENRQKDIKQAEYDLDKARIDKAYNLLTISSNLNNIGKDGVANAQNSYNLAVAKNTTLMTEEELAQNNLDIEQAKYNLRKAKIDKQMNLLQISENLSNLNRTDLGVLQSNLLISKQQLLNATTEEEIASAKLKISQDEKAIEEKKLAITNDYLQSLATINGLKTNNEAQLQLELDKTKELVKEYEKKLDFDKSSLEYKKLQNDVSLAQWNYDKGKLQNAEDLIDISYEYKKIGKEGIDVQRIDLQNLKSKNTSYMNILELAQHNLKIAQLEYEIQNSTNQELKDRENLIRNAMKKSLEMSNYVDKFNNIGDVITGIISDKIEENIFSKQFENNFLNLAGKINTMMASDTISISDISNVRNQIASYSVQAQNESNRVRSMLDMLKMDTNINYDTSSNKVDYQTSSTKENTYNYNTNINITGEWFTDKSTANQVAEYLAPMIAKAFKNQNIKV